MTSQLRRCANRGERVSPVSSAWIGKSSSRQQQLGAFAAAASPKRTLVKSNATTTARTLLSKFSHASLHAYCISRRLLPAVLRPSALRRRPTVTLHFTNKTKSVILRRSQHTDGDCTSGSLLRPPTTLRDLPPLEPRKTPPSLSGLAVFTHERGASTSSLTRIAAQRISLSLVARSNPQRGATSRSVHRLQFAALLLLIHLSTCTEVAPLH